MPPHIHSLSYIHGHVLQKIGYPVRDYFLHDLQRFADVPSAVMAISIYIICNDSEDAHLRSTVDREPRVPTVNEFCGFH